MDLKDFERKWQINGAAFNQFKKLVKQLKPNETDIGISTAFTVDFRLQWGNGIMSENQLVIKVETWGPVQRIEIWGQGNRHPKPVYMPVTISNINKIYSVGMKIYNEMIKT